MSNFLDLLIQHQKMNGQPQSRYIVRKNSPSPMVYHKKKEPFRKIRKYLKKKHKVATHFL